MPFWLKAKLVQQLSPEPARRWKARLPTRSRFIAICSGCLAGAEASRLDGVLRSVGPGGSSGPPVPTTAPRQTRCRSLPRGGLGIVLPVLRRTP